MTLSLNSYGSLLTYTVPDVLPDGITLSVFEVLKPDESSVTLNAAKVGDRTLVHTFLAGELDQVGVWKVRPRVEVGAGSRYLGEPRSFEVVDPMTVQTLPPHPITTVM